MKATAATAHGSTRRQRGAASTTGATPSPVAGAVIASSISRRAAAADVRAGVYDPSPRSGVTVRRSGSASTRAAPSNPVRSSARCASVSETSSPPNARVPVSISYSTQPNAQMSARLSTGLPARLLRAHVGGGAENHAGPRSSRGRRDRRRLRQAIRGGTRRPRAPSPSRGRSRAPSPCRRRGP